MKNKLKVILLLFSVVQAQNQDIPLKSSPFADYQISSQRYITNADGSIMMNVISGELSGMPEATWFMMGLILLPCFPLWAAP